MMAWIFLKSRSTFEHGDQFALSLRGRTSHANFKSIKYKTSVCWCRDSNISKLVYIVKLSCAACMRINFFLIKDFIIYI